ncbi:sensor domain-containing protein [Noviherbaspirillum pedocola]|uniref:PAS domain S-box protein n=1 Tax=Noviherbaspirillum pedocola TaxID=2801341 RepID=A0A934SZL5_9BURK|nr:PAS domain S-box protein [Noviherbaspirillum pedocola]MBK4735629.1 PAS domain S-box protein [Noviherbaspirillum pedocola]
MLTATVVCHALDAPMTKHNESLTAIPAPAGAAQAEAPLQALADDASTILWRSDAHHVCVWMNPSAVARLPGQKLPAMSAWLHHVHPDDRDRVASTFAAARERLAEYQIEYRVLTSAGAPRWVRSISAPRTDAAGNFEGYSGVLTDCSAERSVRMAALLQATDPPLLHESTSDLVGQYLNDGSFTYASPSHLPVLGYEPTELIGRSARDLVHPEDMALLDADLARQTTSGAVGAPLEIRVRHSNGHYRWFSIKTRALLDPERRERIGSIGVLRDINDERAAREELALREERFRSLIALSSDWYWETDAQHRFSFLPVRDSGAGGPRPQDVLGRTRGELVSDESDPGFQELQARLAARASFRDIRYPVRTPSGGRRYACISGEPMIVDGVFRGYRGVGRDVSAEMETARRLAQLADENRALVENSPDIIALLDKDGAFLRVNGAAADILGYAPQALIGRHYAELLPPDERARVAAVDAKMRAGAGIIGDFECRGRRSDGREIWLSVSARWLANAKVLHVTARDVTERYRSSAELQASRDRLDVMLESVGDAFFALDREWRVTYANRKAAAFVGTTPEEGVGKLLWEVAPEMPESEVFPRYLEAMQTRQTVFFEAWWAPAARWVETRIYPSEDGLSVYFHDITAKREAQDRLERSEKRFRNLFDHAGDSILIIDRELAIQDANERACAHLGYERHELLARRVSDIAAVFNIRGDMLAELQPGQSRMVRTVARHASGSTFPVEVHLSCFEEDGKPLVQAIARDMTASEQAQRALRQSEQHLRDILAMTPSGYLRADGESIMTEVNPALCELSGYPREALIGSHMSLLFSACPWKGALQIPHGPTSAHGMEATILHRDGHEMHVLFNGSIRRDEHGLATSLTGFITDITERKGVELRLRELATHDTLTGLPNRTMLHERLAGLLDSAPRDASMAVLMIDLDRFKEVNDSFGHEAGDLLLREAARRLQSAVREGDMVARLGGDEFVVIAHCAMRRESARAVAQKLVATLAAPIDIAGVEVLVGASIGIAMYPEDGSAKQSLLQSADTAMYRAKAAGRNGYCFFDAEMTLAARTRMTLELSLRRALDRGEFELHYQPRMDLKTMSIVGMEALIRWNHPELGRVPPMQFIPLAEERGHIEAIGHWVLREACEQTRRLMGRVGRPLRLSVNLSARQLRCGDLVQQVRAVLAETRLPPSLLELELTESALIEDVERSAAMLRELKALGIQLAVDDFGTGYSALAYLRRFPLDVLKLDRSFVMQQESGVSSFEFVKAFVDMAHALKLSVVAEGVETGEVLQFLRNVACDEAQGYLLARPAPLAEFEGYLMQAATGAQGEVNRRKA